MLVGSLATSPFAKSQRRQKAQSQSGAMTVNATLSYQFGGTQPVAAGDIAVLDENPETLMSCPVAAFITAAILNEPLSIARLRIQVAQARQQGNEVYTRQLESLLKMELENERLRQQLAYSR